MRSLPKALDVSFMRSIKYPNTTLKKKKNLKTAIASINPKMGIATLLSNPVSEMVETKFGSSPMGSTNSYQLSYTEANFHVNININSVPRLPNSNVDINSYPPFPLKDSIPRAYPDAVSGEERTFLTSLEVDENQSNDIELETRDQGSSEKWKEQRKFRFTASRFPLISRRQQNHETFAKDLMNPKEFTSRHTSHGKKYEGTAIHEYQKFMNARKTPVVVLKCGLVVSRQMPTLAATPDGKVVAFGCSQPFRILEVICVNVV